MLNIASKIILPLLFCLSGCATTTSLSGRDIQADNTALKSGFRKNLIQSHNFTLLSYVRIKKEGEPLVVYIEGDGVAWLSRSHPSLDPTPKDTLVLRLASLDPSPNVAYLARPGQYASLGASICEAKYWTGKRFSEEVIEDMDNAVNNLKEIAHAPSISLVGYSGGGAVAVLIAARRTDVISLRTIAGNLDSEAVSKFNKVSILKDSLNPIDVAYKLKGLPRRHFVASLDKIIPIYAAESFAEKTGDVKHESITIVKGLTHYSGWDNRWYELLDMPLY